VCVISLFDAIQLVCEATDMKWRIQQDGTVRIFPKWHELDEAEITRSYTVPQALADSLLNTPNDQPSETDTDKSSFMPTDQPSDVAADKAWKAFFEQLGVTEPKWTTFNYLPVIGKLRVTSTRESLERIDSIFDLFALHMVEVEMQIHAFRTADIECLRLSGGVSLESLMALRKNGKAKPVALATGLTKSGQEAIVKAVKEVCYPTELLTDVGQKGSNVTSLSTVNALVPCNFSMRETGMILQVVPEVSTDNSQINVTLKPQWITLDRWESYPADLATAWTHQTHFFKQPVFGVTTFETQVTVKDGGTILLGSCSTPDGEWVQVAFLTARLRDVQPLYSGGRIDKATTQPTINEPEVVKKMREIMIPEVTFRPPDTIIDAIRFFKEASIRYDKSPVPKAKRGLSFVLNLSANSGGRTEGAEKVDPFAATAPVTNNVPVIPDMSARFISLYDMLKLVCDVTGMKFKIRDNIVWVMPMGDPCDNLMTRTYPVLPSLFEELSADTKSREGEKVWKEFFEQMGVNWPTGSSVSFKNLSLFGVLRITTTPENLVVFEQVLEDLEITPRMIEVDVQIHAFTTEDIEKLRLSGDMSVEALIALRKKGKSKQVASATALTKSGQEACVKSVREMLYPSELLTDCGQVVSNVMSQSVANALMPGNFTMREAGVILQVVPEIATPDASQIHVTIKPQWVTLEGWQSYPAELASGRTHKTLAFKQPVFGTTCFETQVTVEAGKTVLIGSSSTPDGKWVHVGFLTVK
jgi:Flp pilus assembly secretin CpaC